MLKNRYMLLVLLLGLALIAGCGGEQAEEGAGEVAGEVYELSLAHFFPATHPAETELVQGWIDEVKEATDGQVVITSYPGETLSEADEIYGSVVSGIADIGLSCFAYTRGQFPVLEAFELPGIIYESSYAASMAAWEGIQQLNPEEVQDTELMFVLATGPGDLFTNSPVYSLEDLEGMRIRATGLSADTLSVLGAVPDGMSQAEAYEALERVLVQGNLAPVEVLDGWNHAEVTDYLTYTPFLYNTLFFVTMNQNEWNGLTTELQEAILEVNERFHAEVACGLWDKQNEDAMEEVADDLEEIITLSDEEAERWIEAVKPIQDDFVTKMEEKGLDGEAILNTVKDLAEQYGN